MGHHIFFFYVTFITQVAFSSGAEREVTAKIHERFLLPCPTFSDPENVTSIGWYRCSNDDCEHDWNKFLIAYVENMTDTIADNPNFELYTNHTLVIKKVLPVDDGKMFICIVKEKLVGRSMSTTILHIAEEPPKLIPNSPRWINVVEGMDLYMDALVRGYPSPLVTWSHDGLLLQNTWNNDSETSLLIRSVTVYQGGRYTCYAKNPFGDNIFTIDVYVKDLQTPPSSLTSDIRDPPSSLTSKTQNRSASPPPRTQNPSASPRQKKEDGEVFLWLTGLLAALLLIAVTVIIYLVVKIRKPDLRISDHTRGFES